MFINRTEEMLFLEDMLGKKGIKILFLSGRPGMGKTDLLFGFVRNKTALSFSGEYTSSQELLTRFRERAFHVSNSSFFRSKQNNSWEVFFKYVFETAAKKFPVIIIDEFPILCESNQEICEILKKNCMEFGGKGDLFLILSGSNCRFMRNEYLKGAWGNTEFIVECLELKPFKFEVVTDFYPNFSAHKKVYTYAILGGKPAYLRRFSGMKTIEQNVKSEILNKDSFLYQRPRSLLLEEFREPSLYFAILRAIAFDKNQVRAIVEETGFSDVHMVNKYLYVLRKHGFIKRICPVTEPDPERSRKGRYVFEDSFFRFWFRFIAPNISFLEASDTSHVWRRGIFPNLDDFSRAVFRDICIQRLTRYSKYQKLPFKAEKIGAWWDRLGTIDAVAYDSDGSCLFCSCIWTGKKLGVDYLRELKKKAKRFPGADKKYYGLFSKEGFSPELKKVAREQENVLLLPYY